MGQQSHYSQLKDKWSKHHKTLQETLWAKHKDSLEFLKDQVKQIAIGAGASLLLLGIQPRLALAAPGNTGVLQKIAKDIEKNVFLISDLYNILPKDVAPLSFDQEQKAQHVLSRHFDMKIKASLDGKRLNRSYGLIGQEQHLARHPQDTIDTHFDTQEEAKKFYSYGMAPGLGAWGYFAPSASLMTQKDKDREKYYIAVQTFLSEDFNKRFAEYRDFFKYRKMLVVNPQNGKAIVAVIADAGPATWTGKHLGGSPEVMNYLEREDGAKKGPVLYFFIDDPQDQIPLGPIKNSVSKQELSILPAKMSLEQVKAV